MLFIESYIKDEVLKDPNVSLLEATFENLDTLLEETDTEILNEAGGFSKTILKLKVLLLRASQNILLYAIKMKEKLRTYLNKVFVNEKTVKKSKREVDLDKVITGKYVSDGNGGAENIQGKITIRMHIPSGLNDSYKSIPRILTDLQSDSELTTLAARDRVDKLLNDNGSAEDLKGRSTLTDVSNVDLFLDQIKNISKDIHLVTLTLFKKMETNSSGNLKDGDFSLKMYKYEDAAISINSLLKLSVFLTKAMAAMLINFNQDVKIA